MMRLELLGVATPFNAGNTRDQHQSLMQRIQAALDDPSTNPPPEAGLPVEPDAGLPVQPVTPEMAELTRKWAVKMFCDEFMMDAIFGNEEKFGPKPEED